MNMAKVAKPISTININVIVHLCKLLQASITNIIAHMAMLEDKDANSISLIERFSPSLSIKS